MSEAISEAFSRLQAGGGVAQQVWQQQILPELQSTGLFQRVFKRKPT